MSNPWLSIRETSPNNIRIAACGKSQPVLLTFSITAQPKSTKYPARYDNTWPTVDIIQDVFALTLRAFRKKLR